MKALGENTCAMFAALFIGWAVLGEAPSLLSLCGGALVVGRVAMVQRLGQ